MLKTIVHILGGTCVGKSTLIDSMIEKYGEDIAAISAGKALRAKYLNPQSPHFNPNKFKGKGSPPEMEKEALDMYAELIRMAMRTDAKMILVDGQPRTNMQAQIIGSIGVGIQEIKDIGGGGVKPTLALAGSAGSDAAPVQRVPVPVRFRQRFLFMHASDDRRRERLALRYALDDVIALRLGVERIANDDRDNLEVLIELGKLAIPVAHLDTSSCSADDDGRGKLASFAPMVYELFNTEPQ